MLQIYDSYLVVESSDGLMVIDQHALHERILFEQIKKDYSQSAEGYEAARDIAYCKAKLGQE